MERPPGNRSSSDASDPAEPGAASARPSPGVVRLGSPVSEIRGLRADLAAALSRLDVRTVADLIKHLPMRYEELEPESPIGELGAGQIVTARGDVTATRVVARSRKPRFEAVLIDPTGRLDLVWFNMTFLQHRILPGMRLRVHGKAQRHGPGLQLVNPRHEVLPDDPGASLASARLEPEAQEGRTRPVYSASEHITSAQIEQIVGRILDDATAQIDDHLSEEFRKSRELPVLADAYRMAHRPASAREAKEAHRRLAYDELLMLQLGVFLRRGQLRERMRAPALRWSEAVDAAIRKRFPFTLTPAQDAVVQELAADLASEMPTNRLIQGDVGSGKTVIALYGMLMAVAAKRQGAMMAPTELLAEQHFASISKMLEGSEVKVALLTGAVSGHERESMLRRIESGDIDIVVGTHALLTGRVRFSSLGVVVIDEQHRFGVQQRAALREKGMEVVEPVSRAPSLLDAEARLEEPTRGTPRLRTSTASDSTPTAPGSESRATQDPRPVTPHVLVMTATPIPRSLALTLFGDLDVSTIRELPPGRSPITTRIVMPDKSGEVYEWVRTRVEAGDQAFVVVPAIDTGASAQAGSDADRDGEGDEALNDLRTVMARLEAGELKGKRVAAMHGRMKPATRDQVMNRFKAGLIDVLVATTVIEVGVDVPNATVMVIEHAELFGLAQLHQLRGRVGRSTKKSVCVLIADPRTPQAQERIRAIAESTDGFALAERDLEIRGPGEVFGQRQAGAPPLRVADLMRDRDLLRLARRDAREWIKRSPELNAPEERLLKKRLMKEYGAWLGIGDVG